MSDLNLVLRITGDGSGVRGELRTTSGEVVKFSDQLEGGAKRGTRALRETEQQTGMLGRSTAELTRKVAAVAAAYLSLQSASRLMRTITDNTIAQEASWAQLEARVRSTGGAADRTVTQLQAQAGALQGLTTVANEEIERAQAAMLTFTQVAGDQFDLAIERTLDLSIAMGTDLQSAALQVGKALNDPIQGVTALQRAGIQLTQSQREQIRVMVEAGDVASAQRIILAELEQQFGGAARAARDTFGGALQALRNDADDLLKFTGEMPALAGQIESISARLRDPELNAAIEEGIAAALGLIPPAIDAGVTAIEVLVPLLSAVADNSDKISIGARALATVLATRLAASIVVTTRAKIIAIATSQRYGAALVGLAGMSNTAAAGQLALAAGSRAAAGALALVGGPVGLVTLALAGGAIAAHRWYSAVRDIGDLSGPVGDSLERLRGASTGAWDDQQPREYAAALEAINEQLEDEERRLQRLARLRQAAALSLLVATGGASMRALGETSSERDAEKRIEMARAEREALEEVHQAREWVATAFGGQAERYELGARKIAQWTETAVDWLEQYGLVTRNAAGGIGEMAAASAEITDPLERMVEQLERQLFVLEQTAEGRTTAAMALLDYQEKQALAAAADQDAADKTTANVQAVRNYFAQLRSLTGQIDARNAAERRAASAQQALQQQAASLASAYQQLLREADPLRAETERLTALLDQAREMSGLTEEQLESLGLTAEQLAELIALVNDELDDISTERLSGEVEALLRWVEQLDMDPLLADIRTLEDALADATDPAIVGRLEAAIARLRAELNGAGVDALTMLEAYAAGSQQALRAVQQFAGQGTKEFQAMEIAANALALVQGIAAILNQGQGDPYSAPVRMALMAAAIAPLIANLAGSIGNFGGGGSWSDTAGQRQAAQGTGSVLGDAEAKSESILRATEITADATRELVGINRGMLRALLALQRGIGGAVVRLARGAGRADFDSMGLDASGSFASALGPLNLGLGNWFHDPLGILGGSSKITDQGIVIVGGILSDLIEQVVAGAYQEVQSRSWRFGRRRTREGIETLDQGLLDQFSLIFQSLADTVLEGAVALGLSRDEVASAIANFNVAEIRISLLDMTAEEQQAEIEAIFGEIFDGLAGSIVPYIRQFQQVGEGLGETLVRVATGVQITQEAIRRFGWGIDELDPEHMAQISEDLIGLSGGLEEFVGGIVGFFDRFATDAHRLAVAQDDLERAFSQAGITLPATRDEMWELMHSLDATTESGREQIAMLLELAGTADTYYSLLERVTNEGESLERRILQLQGDTATLRELELEKLHESNRHLQERIWAIEDELQIASEKESLERRILQLQGDTATLRELELAGLHESNRHLQERIWAIEDEAAATEQANRNAEELADILRDAGDEMARLTMSPLRFEFRQLTIAQRELTARVRELTDSEDDLAHVRRMQDLQNLALAERARERLRSIQEQLWGVVQSADIEPDYRPIDQAAGRIRDALVRALESVAEWVRRSAFEDPSLTPVQQMDAMQREFDRLMTIALTGSGQEQADAIAALPQLASQMEQLGVQLWGTATQEFHEFRTGLVDAMQRVLDSVVAPPVPDPVTGAQVAGIAGSLQQVALTLAEQKVLAAEALEVLGVIRALTGDSPLEIAREFGVPLRDAIELLIGELSEGTAETIERLAHIANTLGITLGDLSDEIGLNIGELIDHESLLSQALRDVIGALPAGIQDELLEPLMRIWAATSDADANEALAQLLAVTDELPAWIRNLLAPYFEEIDPVDYLIEQVGLLEQIRELDRRQAEAAEATVALLDRVVGNLRAANEAADIPAYARGGWASGVIRTGEIGPELVLPHDVSQFFQRVGVPITSGGIDDRRIVERLDRLVDVEERSGRKLDGIAEAQQRTGIEIATGLQDVRSAVRERDLAWQS